MVISEYSLFRAGFLRKYIAGPVSSSESLAFQSDMLPTELRYWDPVRNSHITPLIIAQLHSHLEIQTSSLIKWIAKIYSHYSFHIDLNHTCVRINFSFVKDKMVEFFLNSWKLPNRNFGLATFRRFMTTPPYSCTTIHRYPVFSTRYSVMCKVYTGYCGTSQIEHGLCACTVDNPLAKARGLSLRTGAQTILYLSL